MTIKAVSATVWKHTTEVDLKAFHDPWYFKLLNIPKPLSAKISRTGKGGKRTAYFSQDRKFQQEITGWEPPKKYAFTFQASKNFKVGYIFNLCTGPFQIMTGEYVLIPKQDKTELTLKTNYTLSKNKNWLLRFPVRGVLKLFQNYFLNGIKKNAEKDVG